MGINLGYFAGGEVIAMGKSESCKGGLERGQKYPLWC
jgi:hypothetical protein